MEAILADRYAVLAERPLVQSWRVYDTFDRRLFARSLTLRWSGEDSTVRRATRRSASPTAFVIAPANGGGFA